MSVILKKYKKQSYKHMKNIFLFAHIALQVTSSPLLSSNRIIEIDRLVRWIDYNAEGQDTIEGNKPLVISLGGDCISAYEIYKHGLRKAAFPFDRIVSPLKGVRHAIEEDFALFLDPISLEKHSTLLHCVYNSYYGFAFAHDFPWKLNSNPLTVVDNFKEFLQEPQEKYTRRIKRFMDLTHSKSKVFFLRTNTPYVVEDVKTEIIKLSDSIKKKIPHLIFEIIIIGRTPDYQQPWNLPAIHNFYVQDINFFDDKTDAAFGAIFKHLGIATEIVTKPIN